MSQSALGKQASKSLKTQQCILGAARELIYEGGFAAASSTRIARLAGVSWGVVQHHFGDKRGILLAVLKECSEAYLAFMSAMPSSGGSRRERIRAHVDRCWTLYRGRDYKIALEIALAMRFQDSQFTNTELLRMQEQQLITLWRSVFPDATASDAAISNLVRHTYIVLSGLVIDQMLESEAIDTEAQLQFLVETIENHLYEPQENKEKTQ